MVLSPRMHDQLEAGGHVPVGGTPAELAAFLRTHLKNTAEQMRIANVKAES